MKFINQKHSILSMTEIERDHVNGENIEGGHVEGDNGVAVINRTKPIKKTRHSLKTPRMYQVSLHNDDFTPRAFVVAVLQRVFSKSENQAVEIMMKAHKSDLARVAVYTYEIAETKAAKANSHGQKNELPLRFSVDPVDQGSE